MTRCAPSCPPPRPRRRLAAFGFAAAGALALLALLASQPAAAQMQLHRNFPKTALRGSIAFTSPPDIVLDGQSARMSPGSRIHDLNNMLVMPGQLTGAKYMVDYTLEPSTGDVYEVWVLSATEAAVKPWPRTVEQAATWTFDYGAQTWTKP